MTFFSGSTTMDAYIDLIADQLIATGAWGTADGTLTAGATPAKRAVTHLTDANFFVYLTRQVIASSGNGGHNEVLIQISSAFNTGTHAPSGTIQTTGIPTESSQGAVGQPSANNKGGSHFTWIDASGFTGFTTWAPSSLYDWTTFFTLERNTTKEYADGLTNFFVFGSPNNNYSSGNQGTGQYYGGVTNGRPFICRPFGITESVDYNNALATFFGAYKSPGNSKVYLAFPFFSNNSLPLDRSPIAQTQRFFLIQPGQGIADGDTVTFVSGANTYTYLVKTMQSPDSASFAPWAIRQA